MKELKTESSDRIKFDVSIYFLARKYNHQRNRSKMQCGEYKEFGFFFFWVGVGAKFGGFLVAKSFSFKMKFCLTA